MPPSLGETTGAAPIPASGPASGEVPGPIAEGAAPPTAGGQAPGPQAAPPLRYEETPRGPSVSYVPPPWASDFAPDELATLEAKAWKTPAEMFRSWQSGQKFLGAPAEELVRLPREGASAEQIAEVRRRMGHPEKATDYDFGEVPIGPGEVDLREPAASWFHELGLTKEQGKGVVERWQRFQAQLAEQADEQWGQQVEGATTRLQAKHGSNYGAMQESAIAFARSLGLDADEVLALEQRMGPERFFERFAALGQGIVEHRVGEGLAGRGSYTAAGARAKIAELMADPAFLDPKHPGGKAIRERVLELRKIADGDEPIGGPEA